jgi:hypothetical protein
VERFHTAPVAVAIVDPAAEAERAAVKARRVEAKQRKQAEARARREQAERARHKA